MSALGMATLGVQCANKALGMASLGVLCLTLTVPTDLPTSKIKEATSASSAVHKPILQLYQPLQEDRLKAIIQEEDEELVAMVTLLINAGIIK